MIECDQPTEYGGLRVSVISVCLNSEATIEQTIVSVNEQTYSNIEHVFIDGCSKDNTLSIIKAQSRRTKLLLSESDHGIYDALNKGLKLATGDIIGFLHADDFFAHPSVIEDIVMRFSTSHVGGVYGDLQYVDPVDTSNVIRHWQACHFTKARLRRGWMPPHPTLYIRRSWYEKTNGFDTRYRISADYFLILQLFGYPDFSAVYIPDVLVKMRVGGASNRSLKNIIRKSSEDLDALRRSGVGGICTLLCKNLRKIGQFIRVCKLF